LGVVVVVVVGRVGLGRGRRGWMWWTDAWGSGASRAPLVGENRRGCEIVSFFFVCLFRCR
jgi:hypothetical protein